MVTVTIKEKEYKLYLRMIDVIALEKELGDNPINLFVGVQEEGQAKVPFKFSDMVLVIKYSLRQNHKGMKDESVYALVDEWLEEEENGLEKMIEVVMELLKRFF